MGQLSVWHLVGAAAIFLLITAVGLLSGKKVKNASDFSSGGSGSGALIVVGMLVGTLVGGASTIGTAQLAFTNGFSGVWFTLGGGLGCALLGTVACKPLRHSGCSTLQQCVTREYGSMTGIFSAALSVVSIEIAVLAQMLSAVALIQSIVPMETMPCALFCVALMLLYVLFGGVWGVGMGGVIKTVLLYATTIVGGAMAIWLAGGPGALYETLPKEQYFNIFGRGFGIDGGAGLSLVFGVLSTQTYAQCVRVGRTDKIARKGVLLSALLIPPIGLGGVLIGMYMQISAPETNSAQVFGQFVLQHMPGVLGGVILATLLVAIVGASAGLCLGAATNVAQDLYKRARPQASDKQLLAVTRISIVIMLAVTLLFMSDSMQSAILKWSFMSQALRATMLFFPLLGALFLPGKIERHFAAASMVVGPVMVFLGQIVIKTSFDPLFLGMGCALLLMIAGYAVQKFRGVSVPSECAKGAEKGK